MTALSVLSAATHASAEAATWHDAKLVAPYAPGSPIADGMTRLRLDLTSNENVPSSNVRLGAVILCSRDACFKAVGRSNVDLFNTADGNSTQALEAVIPTGEVTDVFFEQVAGPKVVAGSIHLQRPLKIDRGFKGGEILVVLERRQSQEQETFTPVAIASNLFRDEFQAVYYNPRFATSAQLKLGAKLEVPEGATSEPQVFSISVDDIGGAYPLIDIYPVVKLMKPGVLLTKPTPQPDFDPETGVLRSPSSALPPSEQGTFTIPQEEGPAPILRTELTETGGIRPNAKKTSAIEGPTLSAVSRLHGTWNVERNATGRRPECRHDIQRQVAQSATWALQAEVR